MSLGRQHDLARPPIRVAFVLPAFAQGGSERQTLMLASGLHGDRFTVELVVLGERTPLVAEAEALGIPVHVLGAPAARSVNRVRFGIAALISALRFVALVRRRRYQVLDAWLYHAYVLAAVTRPFTRVLVLLAGRRSLSGWKERLGPIQRSLDRFARQNVDLIVANSQAVAADVIASEGLDPTQMRVIRNAVAIPAPLTQADRATIRKAWAVANDSAVIGCVANPRPDKGLDVLISALATAPLPDHVRVVIVGDGPQRPSLERTVSAAGLTTQVRFVGAVQDARPIYEAFDLVVGPSRAEGLPNSILEAAAAGRAIVATRAGGTAEILTDGETGLLVPVEDPVALRAALDRLLADPELRARLGNAARTDVASRFAIERLVAETSALYFEQVSRASIARG